MISSMSDFGKRSIIVTTPSRAFADAPDGSRRSEEVRQRTRNLPVDSRSARPVSSSTQEEIKTTRTVLDIAVPAIGVSHQLDVQKSATWTKDSSQVVSPLDGVRRSGWEFPSHDHAGIILHATSTSEAIAGVEGLNELGVGQSRIRSVHLARKDGGELAVKINQLLRICLTFNLVSVQQGVGYSWVRGGRRQAVEVVCQLPGQVIRIHHGDIHSLASFGAMGVARY